MRSLQVALFVIGVVCLVVSAFFAGGGMGDTLWRAGVAVLLSDLVLMGLWRTAPTHH